MSRVVSGRQPVRGYLVSGDGNGEANSLPGRDGNGDVNLSVVRRQYQSRLGFRPRAPVSVPPTSAERRARSDWQGCEIVYRSWELIDLSVTVVPGNRNALTTEVLRTGKDMNLEPGGLRRSEAQISHRLRVQARRQDQGFPIGWGGEHALGKSRRARRLALERERRRTAEIWIWAERRMWRELGGRISKGYFSPWSTLLGFVLGTTGLTVTSTQAAP